MTHSSDVMFHVKAKQLICNKFYEWCKLTLKKFKEVFSDWINSSCEDILIYICNETGTDTNLIQTVRQTQTLTLSRQWDRHRDWPYPDNETDTETDFIQTMRQTQRLTLSRQWDRQRYWPYPDSETGTETQSSQNPPGFLPQQPCHPESPHHSQLSIK